MPSLETIFSVLDIVQLAVGVVDCISDLAVIADFREQSYMEGDPNRANIFFWTCLFLFITGSFIETCLFFMSIEKRKYPFWVPWLTKWCQDRFWKALVAGGLLLPFAQVLCPALSFVLSTFYSLNDQQGTAEVEQAKRQKQQDDVRRARQQQQLGVAAAGDDGMPPPMMEAAAAREYRALAEAQLALTALDSAVVKRRVTMFVSNVAALAGSLPQCAVQLFAISISTQPPTQTQSVSLLLSLFGLLLHAPQVCRSFRTSAFLAKVSFIAYDVLSLSFICSTIFAGNFSLDVVGICYKMLVVACLAILFFVGGLFVLIEVAVMNRWPWTSKDNALGWAVCMLAVAVLFFPCLIVLCGVRLGWLVLLSLVSGDEDKSGQPESSMLYEWLWRNHGTSAPGHFMTDWFRTFRKVEAFLEKTRARCETSRAAYLEWQRAVFPARGGHAMSAAVGSSWHQQITASISALRQAPEEEEHHAVPSPLDLSDGAATSALSPSDLGGAPPPGDDLSTLNNAVPATVPPASVPGANDPLPPPPAGYFRAVLAQPDGGLARLRFAVCLQLCRQALRLQFQQAFARAPYTVAALPHVPTSRWQRRRAEAARATSADEEGDTKPVQLPPPPPFYFGTSIRNKTAGFLAAAPLTWPSLIAHVFNFSEINMTNLRKVLAEFQSAWQSADWDHRSKGITIGVLLLTFLNAIVVGLFFVPLHVLWHGFSAYNDLQRVLCAASLVSLAVALLFSPTYFRYVVTLQVLGYSAGNGTLHVEAITVPDVINEYNSVPISHLRTAAVPSQVIPPDALDEHVLAFLSARHCGLFGLSGKEIASLRLSGST